MAAAGQGGSNPVMRGMTVSESEARPKPAQGRTSDVDWFVAIKGKQHGPSKEDEVMRLFRDGKISERTYCWNEGLTAWTRLRDLPEFASLLNDGGAPKRPGPPPPPSDEPHGAEVVSLDQARQQRAQREGGQDAGRSGGPVTPSSSLGPVVGDPFSALASSSGSNDAPRESTRVFIMQAGLHNRGKKHKLYAGIAVGCVTALVVVFALDWYNIAEIPGLHGVVAKAASAAGIEHPKPKDVDWGEAGDANNLACKLRGDCPKEAARGPRRHGPRPATGVAGGSEDIGDIGTGEAPVEPGLPTRTVLDANGMATVDPMASTGMKFTKNDGGKKMAGVTSRMETPAVADNNLDPANVKKVVQSGQTAVQSCVEAGAKQGQSVPGRQLLTLTIEPNGVVSGAKFQNMATGASSIGECIQRAAKKWKFAPSGAKDGVDVDIPMALSIM